MKKVVMLTGDPTSLEEILFFSLRFDLVSVEPYAYVRISDEEENADKKALKKLTEEEWIQDCTDNGHTIDMAKLTDFINLGKFNPKTMAIRFYLTKHR